MTSSATRRADAVAEALQRAVRAGIISADQAEAVLAAERSRAERGGVRGRGLPVTEAVGYLGGLLALSGAVTLALQYWPDLPIAGRLAVLGAVAVITWVVGARIDDSAAPALLRLRGALWFASSVAVAAFAGQLAWDVARVEDAAVTLAAGAAGAAQAALLWRLRDRPAQHFACLAGVLIAVGSAAELVDGAGPAGLAVAVLGAGWVLAGWYGLLPPAPLALAGGAAAVLIGTGSTAGEWTDAAPVLGLAAAAALAGMGVAGSRPPLTVVGLLGSFVYLPWTIGHFFAESLGVPLAMVLCGVALLAVTLLLLRRSTGLPTRPPVA